MRGGWSCAVGKYFFLNMSAGSVFVRISLDAKDVATREKTVFHIEFGGFPS